MTPNDTPSETPVPPAHVLARELASRIAANASEPRCARVLVVGVGSGRNLAPFRDAGIDVTSTAAADVVEATGGFGAAPVRLQPGSFAGALSTHALLHGTARDVAATLLAIRACLRPGAPLYATFGSTRDPRFGRGRRIDDATFAPSDGPEAGVPHVYFDSPRLRALLRGWHVETLDEVAAAEHVGAWAHDAADAATIVHWFVRATARDARADQ